METHETSTFEIVDSVDYIEGNPQRFEKKDPFELLINEQPYEFAVYLDHRFAIFYYVLVRRDTTACKPIVLMNITEEANQDTAMRDTVLTCRVKKHEA